MALSEHDKFKRKLIWVALLGVTFLALDTYFEPRLSFHPKLNFCFKLGEKAGEALIIAVVIAVLVDITAKKEVLREFLEEISSHIIGRQLPEPVREQIRAYLSTDFIRPSWTIQYTLKELANPPGVVELKSFFTGPLENRGTKTKTYPFKGEVDDTWIDGVGKARIIRAAVKGSHSGDFDTATDASDPELVIADGIKTFARDVEVRPAPANPITTVLECVEYLPVSYVYPFVCMGTASKVTLTILYPKGTLRVDVSLSTGEDGKIERSEFADGSIWTIQEPLLPGQCILTNWQHLSKTFKAKQYIEPNS